MFGFAALLTVVLPSIWVVDQNNGPGTNFADLPAAVAAAQHGDKILVRSGIYTAFQVSGKALTIIGAGSHLAGTRVEMLIPGAAVGARATIIDAVPAGSVFTMIDLRFTIIVAGTEAALAIKGSSTTATLVNVLAVGTTNCAAYCDGSPGLDVQAGVVHASHCYFGGGYYRGGATTAAGSALAADLCEFGGGEHGPGIFVAGNATLTRTTCYGGTGVSSGASAGTQCGAAVYVAGFMRISGWSLLVPSYCPTLPTINCAGVFWPWGDVVIQGSVAYNGPLATGGSVAHVSFGPWLPSMSIVGTPVGTGKDEINANLPVTVSLSGILPNAPFVLVADTAPDFSTALAPFAVGELLMPLPSLAMFSSTLDANGAFSFSFTPATDLPFLTNVVSYAQFAVFDAGSNHYLLSNGTIHAFDT